MRLSAKRSQAVLFVLPALAVLGIFVLYPIAATFVMSLFSWKAMSPERHWVGLNNYAELLRDPVFVVCLKNNGLWVVLSLALQLPAALLLAVVLSGGMGRVQWLRAAFFTPFVVPIVAVALVWWVIYEPNFGLARAIVGWLWRLAYQSQQPTIAWLGDPRIATLSIIVVACWRYLGFHMMVMLAGLQAIPVDYYEAAVLDGATPWRAFRHVTLPLMRRVILVDALLIVVGSVKVFELIWVMTGGGPHHVTEVLATYMYYCGFTVDRMGYSAAVASIMIVLTLAATAVYLRAVAVEPEQV
ncbi:MAG: sugar ABC transporter permease [Armatimonadetes bacterium]|nr:sugar ABC transporter permease [Armatimonadota bacterium]